MTLGVLRSSARGALVLLAFAVVWTGLLAITHEQTREPIARSEERAKLALLRQVIAPNLHDNDLLRSTVAVPAAPLLGTSEATTAYLGRRGGEPTALAFEAVAPDGYAGRIRLLVAVRPDGTLLGVRVISHAETPGLGDYIEAEKSDWIRGFEGRTLDRHNRNAWRVRKDGGDFDAMAGATITPRAVVTAVAKALEFFSSHRAQLLAGKDGT